MEGGAAETQEPPQEPEPKQEPQLPREVEAALLLMEVSACAYALVYVNVLCSRAAGGITHRATPHHAPTQLPNVQGNEADEAKFAGLLLLVKHLQQQQQSEGEKGEEDPLAAGDGEYCTYACLSSSSPSHPPPHIPLKTQQPAPASWMP